MMVINGEFFYGYYLDIIGFAKSFKEWAGEKSPAVVISINK